jgi:hypothetical protein
MIYRKITPILIFMLILVACQALRPEISTSVIPTPEHRITGTSLATTLEPDTPSPITTSTAAVNPLETARFKTVAEAEQLAGFNVQEPGYLPEGVSFDYATYQETPQPVVALYYKIVHPQYGDMGVFFHIQEEPQAERPAEMIACGEANGGICEVLSVGATPVIYHRYSGGTEGLDWHQNGTSFRLLRTAGEPGKVYKEELVKVVASLNG